MSDFDKLYLNCWEFWKCSESARKECPAAIKGEGKKCWVYMENLKPNDKNRPYKTCKECPWYKLKYKK